MLLNWQLVLAVFLCSQLEGVAAGGCCCGSSCRPKCPTLIQICPPPPPCPCSSSQAYLAYPVQTAARPCPVCPTPPPCPEPSSSATGALNYGSGYPQNIQQSSTILPTLTSGSASTPKSAFDMNRLSTESQSSDSDQDYSQISEPTVDQSQPLSSNGFQDSTQGYTPGPAPYSKSPDYSQNCSPGIKQCQSPNSVGNGQEPQRYRKRMRVRSRVHRRHRLTKRQASGEAAHQDTVKMCNNKLLKSIMVTNINSDIDESRKTIQRVAEKELKMPINVICADGDLSYVAHTATFCQITYDNINCYAFAN